MVAVPLVVDNLAVVQQSIQHGGGNDGTARESLPIPETLVDMTMVELRL
jgi:hypothetical protein